MINRVALITLPPVMEICLLGLIETLIPTIAKRTLVGLLLFLRPKANSHAMEETQPSLLDTMETFG